jgi:hypothetical protein
VWALALSVTLLACLLSGPACATPYDYLSVGDPLEIEVRILDLLDPKPLNGRFVLPHINTRPYQLIDLMGAGAPPSGLDPSYRISVARLERAFGRDAPSWFTPHPEYRSTRRLYQKSEDDQHFEISSGLAGRAQIDKHGSRFVNGSGLESRIAIGLDHWLAYTRFVVGRFDSARTFSDPIVPNSDLIVLTEETYIAYTSEQQRWAMQFGQNRWHWGPGEEGSLVLSRSAPSMTGLTMRAHMEALKLDLISLSATLEQAGEEQLAAHRIEWQPHERLRVAVTESARYHWPGWQPLYLLGAIPYVLVQRLHLQNEPDSLAAHRNNILTAFDASWRVANGTRVYGEVLIDDLHARSGKTPNKYAFQLGYDGVGNLGSTRLTWGGEYTRVTRFVYTSFFGRDYVVQGQPLGFPVSPDSRRIRLRGAWDPNPDWQLNARVTRSDKGENDLDEPFIPRSPHVNSAEFEGVLETTRELELGVRWNPASGVDMQLSGGFRWINQPDHVANTKDYTPVVAILVRVMR